LPILEFPVSDQLAGRSRIVAPVVHGKYFLPHSELRHSVLSGVATR
jgi:hypothetical protein